MKLTRGVANEAGAAPQPHLHEEISSKIAKGDHLDLLYHRRGRMVQTVDFQQTLVTDAYLTGLYQMFLSSTIPKSSSEVVCLLPNNQKYPDQQVIRSSKYGTNQMAFNKDLNASMEASLDSSDGMGRVKLAVCYGNHIYICNEISGTVYIVWATHINRTNSGNVANTLYTNVPMIINMDGQAKLKAIFILKPTVADVSDLDRVPITAESPRLLFKRDSRIFVCEVYPDAVAIHKNEVRTMSHRDALATVMTLTKDSLAVMKRERNLFATSIDVEVEVGEGFDGGTPRMGLYMEEFVGGPLAATPPVIQSEGEGTARDPFDE